jgi:hypothetical protein
MPALVDEIELNGFGRIADALLKGIYKLYVDAAIFIVLALKNSDLVFVNPVGALAAVTQREIALVRHQRY